MINDTNPSVSKSAIYTLAKTAPLQRVATHLETMLRTDDRTVSSFGELLGSFVHHAEPHAAEHFLMSLIESTELESRQRDCISALAQLGAYAALDSLTYLLPRRPRVTWGLHIALLDIYAERRTTVENLPEIDTVDDLRMAEALLRYGRSIQGNNAAVTQDANPL